MGWGRKMLTGELELEASSNGRYLVDGRGAPFFLLIKRADHLIEKLTLAQAVAHANAFPQFSAFMVQLIARFFADEDADNEAGVLPFSGTISGGHFDLTTPNDAYFDHAVDVVNALGARNRLVFLRPLYPGFEGSGNGYETAIDANGDSSCQDYGEYLGTKFAACPNLIWVYFGDNTSATMVSRMNALRTGIESTDRADRLTTVHLETASTSDSTGTGGVSGWTTTPITATYSLNTAFPPTSENYNQNPHGRALTAYASATRPLIEIEPMGEAGPGVSGNDVLTGADYRSLIWQIHLSGSVHTVLYQTATAAEEDDDSPGQQACAHLATLLRSRFHELVPNTGSGLVTSGGGNVGEASYKCRALTADATLGIVHIRDGSTVTLNLAVMAGTGNVTARYYDPSSGVFTTAPGSPFAQGSQVFVASSDVGTNDDGDDDWILVLET